MRGPEAARILCRGPLILTGPRDPSLGQSRVTRHPLSPLEGLRALLTLYIQNVGCLSAAAHPSAPIAFSVAFLFMKITLYRGVRSRGNAMLKRGDNEKGLGASELTL